MFKYSAAAVFVWQSPLFNKSLPKRVNNWLFKWRQMVSRCGQCQLKNSLIERWKVVHTRKSDSVVWNEYVFAKYRNLSVDLVFENSRWYFVFLKPITITPRQDMKEFNDFDDSLDLAPKMKPWKKTAHRLLVVRWDLLIDPHIIRSQTIGAIKSLQQFICPPSISTIQIWFHQKLNDRESA